MAKGASLVVLFEAESEPTPKAYKEAVDDTIKNPQQISSLTEETVRDDVLILLTTRSNRLGLYFGQLRAIVRQYPKSSTTSSVAAETVIFLVRMLPSLHQLLDPTEILKFLIPALDICFVPIQRPTLRDLASVLAETGTLLEYVTSDRYGSDILRQWACILGTSVLDTPILESWTERLVTMVGSCMANHDVAQAIQQCGILRSLKNHLRSLEARHSRESFESIAQNELQPLSSMTQLSKDDKKTRHIGEKEPETNFVILDDNTKENLKIFDMPDPKSWSALRNVVERLEGDETSKMHLSVMTHFPCELCIHGLKSSAQIPHARMLNERIEKTPNLQIEIMGEALGVWQILLSMQAMRSFQEMGRQGLIKPVEEKLREMASGCWRSRQTTLTGTEAQRKRLNVSLFSTEFGLDRVILWQVDIGTTRDCQMPEQVIKIWEFGSLSKMDKVFDNVSLLQTCYPLETIRRCRQRPSSQGKKLLPARFEASNEYPDTASGPRANLDVRTVDQGVIDMANKFYALTEPLFRAVVANDLSAEFPFDLSTEEARVISHFQTPSLILGRSGTGKTTCLVFKMVGKYLTSKLVMGELPVKQVLLTRSSFLADKLRAYTRGLIKTLESKSVDAESPTNGEESILSKSQEDLRELSVSSLGEHSFPLVLTFDDFLQILENTVEIFDRKSSSRPDPSRYGQNAKLGTAGNWQNSQLVDFHTFKLDYWPRLPQPLTRNLSVDLVFAEIMGVIKGSASSGKSLAPLSRQEYLDRSCRLAPVFVLEDDRSLVYDIFQKYEDIKKQNQDVDNVDRVVRIMSAIRRDTSLKQLLESTFDEIYIDEVQDQRCVDIQLLLEFIKDSRGLHFAGDTAQAISQDSTFRFSDVKAIIYEHFAPASIYANQSQLAHTTMFTLSKNYRSHQGILALASLIMGMMWKGFPETVDKLEPEIGNLNGPKPILFLRCDANILRTSNVGLVNLSDRTADFGAEQVILVRDEAMKARLQGEIGDIALILTILDSKGMEFDDVILWDFFASTSDPSGVRSLRALTADAQSAFDGQGHSGMCSELKNLYVAITRARIQFIMIESSEKAMVTIVDLLTSGPSGSLVDVTRPHDAGFAEKLKMLRPGTSIDPVRYSLRGEEFMQRGNYEEAIWCFHRAKDERGETIANGKLFEAKGRECQAQNDVQGFIQNLEAAIRFFLQTDKIGDAAKNYERLTKFRDAAELWLKHNESAKAAPFFAKAGLYVQASECYDRIGNYSGAAAVLREGEQYDEMVCYLCNNRENIPYESFQSFNLLCKMLLKKNKISFNYRNYAIKILGSLAEQEKCFSEYGMNDELADLYASHMRHKDLFHLLSKNEKLEEALSLAITKDLLHSTADGLEPEVLSLLDYVWAGHLSKSPQQHSTAPLNLPSGFLTPSVRLRAEQWKVSSLVYNLEGSLARQQFANMESSVPKTILCLQKVLGATTIAQQTIIDDFPFEMIQHAVSFAKDLTLDKASDTVRTALLLNGVWKPESGKENLIVLPWSPLREMLTNISKIDASKVVIQQILDRLASGMLAFDTKARDLWKKKWPERCVHFMTLQYCPRKRNGEECHWLHQLMDTDDCSRKLNDLLQVNSVFCGLAPLHYRRCMNETFQERYFGIKRHWNERLLREFVHLSAVEQCTSVITKTGKELFYDRKYIAISSSLEELLFFRLVREWSERNNFTSLLEQMQLAQTFSPNVQNRIFRALSHRLHRDQRGLLQNHLSLLSSITQGLSCQDALAFQSNLNAFLRNLHNIDVQAFSTLHALTAVFEYLAAYLILKTCVSGCMLTQAWVDLDVPRFAHAVHSEERLEWFEWNHKYQQCLMELTKAFCGILRRLNEVPQPGITLLCKGNTHHALLLRQRNVELVAIVVANLAPTTPVGFGDLWTIAKEVFEYGFVRAYYMRSSTALEVAPKLVSSFSKYNGKNSLIVVIKDRKKGSHFSALERQPSVKTVAFDQICPVAKSPAATQASAQISPSTTLDSPQEEYTETEIEAASKIQDFWRCCSRKIKIRRSYMELPRARAIAHFISLGAESPATLTFVNKLAFRDTLISQGVAMSSRLADARETLFKLQEEAMTCAENVEISSGSFESVDDALHRNGEVETLLKKAEETMSPEYMRGVVRMGVLTVLKKAMKDIGKLVAEAEREMLQTRKMIDQVSRSCT